MHVGSLFPLSLSAILSPYEDSNADNSCSSNPKRTHAEAFPLPNQPHLLSASSSHQHRPSIASTGEPSPRAGIADDGSAGVIRGGFEQNLEKKKLQKRVRSSIACARCRRNKTKCVNEGVHSTCRPCAQSKRECTYPVAASTPAPSQSKAQVGAEQEADIDEREKQTRKIVDTGRGNSSRGEDALESSILTKQVWDELYKIFKLHFSTEMSFLHPPTFRNRMRQAAFPRDPSTTPADLEKGRVLLLGVLTLTARFHGGLVAHHSPSEQDPLAASEYYANVLAIAFGPASLKHINPSLENIQALLMLGLYEWGQTKGVSAWLYIGIAVSLAQSMGLTYKDDHDNLSLGRAVEDPRKAGAPKTSANPPEDAVDKEARRRTVWSCFIMDRMLGAGKYRPTTMSVSNLRVQLPCSDDQFLFAQNVQTGSLNPDSLKPKAAEQDPINDDGVLREYIRLVGIFGRLSEWIYAGGRRTEEHPPWDESTKFFRLRHELQRFYDELPSDLRLTEDNLSAHIEKRNATTYASLHTLYSLCLIMLHREYIPFIPLRCDKPSGPLDEPTFPRHNFNIPTGFWEESAQKIMKASRDIIYIVSTCQDSGFLPESPQIGFALWQAAFFCVYAKYFPQMDENHHLIPRDPLFPSAAVNANLNKGLLCRTKKILSELAPRLSMVKRYLKSIDKMDLYFHDVYRTYCVKWRRKPYTDGGLEQYKQFEEKLNEFGDLRDPHQTIASNGSDTVNEARSRTGTTVITGSSLNGEAMQGVETAPQRPNAAWAAVNAASSPVEVDERPRYEPLPYGVSITEQSFTPSLISTSNCGSTSEPKSPYSNRLSPSTSDTEAKHSNLGFEEWLKHYEGITMNTDFDNFGQHNILKTWPKKQNLNFMQAIWNT